MEPQDFDQLIYYRPVHAGAEGVDEEPNIIELKFNPGPDIEDFKKICATLAVFLGYHTDNVEETFGLTTSENTVDIKILSYHRK